MENAMWDVIVLLGGLGFFGLTVGFVRLCGKL